MHEDYNDLAMWDYTRIPFDFGGAKDDEEYPIHTHRIHTWRDLTELLSSQSFCNSPGLQFVDVRMDKFDIPEKFKVVFRGLESSWAESIDRVFTFVDTPYSIHGHHSWLIVEA
jgi:TPP-dependent 2-oxoacid decarboxylase